MTWPQFDIWRLSFIWHTCIPKRIRISLLWFYYLTGNHLYTLCRKFVRFGSATPELKTSEVIGHVSYVRISLCYFCFRWKTVSLVQASMQHLMHLVTVSLQQSKITLQNNCINNTSITQPTLSFYLWLKM